MRCRLLLAVVVLLGLTAFAPAPFPKADKKKDRKSLEGTWTVADREYGSGGSS
jgi:hypothetical protein